MKHLADYDNSPLRSADTIIAGVRIYLGFLLLWKGLEFFFNQSVFNQYFDNIGPIWFTPVAALHYVFLAHLFGGICLIGGMGTRWAAMLQVPILGAAVFLIHLPALLSQHIAANAAEAYLAIFSLILICFFTVRGSGTYSIDYKTVYDEEHLSDDHHPEDGHHA
ncbi:DoxX family protein [Lentisphaera marina]|uniref:DoxX family protein n=1 Tax=Lentisphaera marina TaxID=1111041 RepID=UPI002366F974|nr:DoxX family protein [Lentisphaera marina]MDD7984854.1 DoxX family protein [Lentisphaera marina]